MALASRPASIRVGYSKVASPAEGSQRVDDYPAFEIDVHHCVRADARAMVREHRADGVAVVRRDRFAECEIARQHARGQLEFFRALFQLAREHALTDVELFFDFGARVLGVRRVHEHERRRLHEREQRHEQHDDAGLEAANAHQEAAVPMCGLVSSGIRRAINATPLCAEVSAELSFASGARAVEATHICAEIPRGV